MTKPITVLVVEDHRVLAQGLQLALGMHDDIAVIGAVTTAQEAIDECTRHAPDVVLMDFHLPDATGAQATRQIKENCPDIAVVILSGDTGDEAMLAALEAGVAGYISKTEFASEVAAAVRRAAAGEVLVDPATLLRLLNHQKLRQVRTDERNRLRQSLTQRELEILKLMATGLDSQDMAERLHISVTTVRGHVQSVIEKLGAHSRLEAVALATTHDLLQM